MADLTGKTLGNYRIVERIGRGGMATVYKAYQPALERYVAVKVIHEQLVADDEQFLKRFRREAKAVASLRHPNIVQVFDFGTEDDVSYMVMEYLEGTTLKAELNALVERGETMPLEEAQRIFRTLASALEHAHRQGMVHRDIKPANVMLTAKGDVVLTDFGIAKIVGGTQYTATGAFTGTPAYMSPEQGQGERGDERSDIYALGVMLYEMVTGRVPFDADTPLAVILKHISAPLPLPRQLNPTIPEVVEQVIFKALAKAPDDRYQTVAQMASALEAALAGEAVPIREERPPELAVALPAPSRWAVPWTFIGLGLVGLGLLAVAIAIGVVGGIVLVARRPTPTPGVTPTATETAVETATPTATALATSVPTPSPTAPGPVPLTLTPTPTLITPEGAQYLYDSQGREPVMSAETWEKGLGGMEAFQGEIVSDPKGLFGQVARLSVRGYGHGKQTAWIQVSLDVPTDADIVSIPVATSANGPVGETDSESGLEIAVCEPGSDQTVWTYASHLFETKLGVPYLYAFADVSAFQGQRVELTMTLRQVDVCAGSLCTHDADFYLGDLSFERLPDICTTEADRSHRLYDYYDDPTSQQVAECENPQPYYFLDVEDGPYNAYGAGEDTYTLSFDLPEGAELLEFHLYYGYRTQGLTVNDQTLSPEKVYAAFPLRSGTYVNIAEPSRHSPMNNNPQAVAPYFRAGANTITMTVSAEKHWEERPFDLFARFRVPQRP
jgi:tRNA A-37 threonylcarbamoyl transferase component Bud32